jgi:hypothetical protein
MHSTRLTPLAGRARPDLGGALLVGSSRPGPACGLGADRRPAVGPRIVVAADLPAGTAALGVGRPGGAVLGVFETESLSETSPSWGLPDVIISPHMAGISSVGGGGCARCSSRTSGAIGTYTGCGTSSTSAADTLVRRPL